MQRPMEGVGALPGFVVGTGIAPCRAGLHQALGLAIGAERTRARAQVAHAEPPGRALQAARPAAGAVVGQHPLQAHAHVAVIAHRADQGHAGTGPALVRLDGGEGHARGIVDDLVDVLTANAPMPLRAVAGDTEARRADPPQFPDVQMQQFARQRVSVAVLRHGGIDRCHAPGPGARHHCTAPLRSTADAGGNAMGT